MKNIYLLAASCLLLLAGAVYATSQLKNDSLFNANVEALADVESGFWGKEPCQGQLSGCTFFCPHCGTASYIPGQLGPVNVDNIWGKCVQCGYEKHL